MQEEYSVYERIACEARGVAYSSLRLTSLAEPLEPLRQLTQARVAYGYRRLNVLLCREGWLVNHKRVQWLYRDEGLTQQQKRPNEAPRGAPAA